MWFDILKNQELVPKEEEVGIELDTDALSDKCCQEAKEKFLRGLLEAVQQAENTSELLPLEEDLAFDIETMDCAAFREFLHLQVKALKNEPGSTPLDAIPEQLLEEWEDCEGWKESLRGQE